MTPEPEILFERRGGVGFVLLDRPKALNALSLTLLEAFDVQLRAWVRDPTVHAVVVRGAGNRAFCAGGDIRSIWHGGRTADGQGDGLASRLFRREYMLIRRIKMFPKPYVPLIGGIAMGGGVGVCVHGSHRVATERTLLALPETRIGLFPDVGSSYFLPRLAGALGSYLGLTGARLKAADSYAHLGERDTAIDLYQRIIVRYGADSDYGRLAQAHLENVQAGRSPGALPPQPPPR